MLKYYSAKVNKGVLVWAFVLVFLSSPSSCLFLFMSSEGRKFYSIWLFIIQCAYSLFLCLYLVCAVYKLTWLLWLQTNGTVPIYTLSFTKPESVDQDIAWITLYTIFVIDQKRNRRGPDSFVNRNEFCILAPAFYNPLSNSISVLSYSITIL